MLYLLMNQYGQLEQVKLPLQIKLKKFNAFIRGLLTDLYGKEVAENVTVQYGGSMNDGNAADLIAQTDIDGGLVGGASLIPEKFAVIIKAGDTAAK